MMPQEFIVKWQRATLSERSAAQQHFLDLCDLLGQPKPAAADPEGAWYTFERGVSKSPSERRGVQSDGERRGVSPPVTSRKGWADVWMREHFAWEYKGKHKDLVAAYQQLQLYREDLENPPLLVVCDMDRFEVHTNFTNTPKEVHAFNLAGLAEPHNLDVFRKVFTDPQALKPRLSTKEITEEIAKEFGKISEGMRERGIPPSRAAHFLTLNPSNQVGPLNRRYQAMTERMTISEIGHASVHLLHIEYFEPCDRHLPCSEQQDRLVAGYGSCMTCYPKCKGFEAKSGSTRTCKCGHDFTMHY